MFLYKLDEEIYQSLAKEVMGNKDSATLFARLKNGEFRIFYRYEPSANVFNYYALGPEEEAIAFSVDSAKRISSLWHDFSSSSNSEQAKTFAYFIASEDKDASLDTLKRRYATVYERVFEDASLSTKEAKALKNARDSLRFLKEKLMDEASFIGKEKLDFEFLFHYEKGQDFLFNLRAFHGKRFALQSNLSAFSNSFLTSGAVTIGKETYFPEQYVLEDSTQTALKYLLSNCSIGYSRNAGLVKEVVFVSFLWMMEGKHFTFEGNSFLVPKAEKIEVSIGEKGDIEADIWPKEGELCFFGEAKAVFINNEEKSIHLYEFRNRQEATLYEFASKNKEFPFDKVGSIISNEILPLLNGTKINESFQKAHPTGRSEITYYVDYREDGSLDFKTVFNRGNDEISLESFLDLNDANPIRYKRFSEELEKRQLPENGKVKEEDKIADFLTMNLDSLLLTCKVMLSDNLYNRKTRTVSDFHINAHSGIDWFSLSVKSEQFSDEELALILKAYQKKKKFVRLKDSFVLMDEMGEEIKKVAEDFPASSLDTHLPLFEALKLERYAKENVSLTQSLKDMFAHLLHYQDISLDELKPSLAKILRPYQKDAVKWLLAHYQYGLGAILADEMGLGKTLETIAFLSLVKTNKPILVVTPKSLIYNWESEFHKFDQEQIVKVIDGPSSFRDQFIAMMKTAKKTVFIMSYDSLRSDIDKLEGASFSFVILDEAQVINNVKAKKSQATKRLKADYRFVLTGTPIQNRLLDLWSIFDFLHPGYLENYGTFKAKYGDLSKSDPSLEIELKKKVAPFYLKRFKKDVLKDLPQKDVLEMLINMGDEQRKTYEANLSLARSFLKGTKEYHSRKEDPSEKGNKILLLSALTKLREICVDPSVLDEDENAMKSAKIETLVSSCLDLIHDGHKILIFSTFVKVLNHVKEAFEKEHLASYLICGDTSATERIDLANSFNTKDDVKIMLVSLKAGGTGLNLVGADVVFLLDPWWNLAAEDQAMDRAHRLGQTRPVTVYKLIAKNSIEEKILELQEKKKDLANVLSGGEEVLQSALSDEDLDYLLS